MSVSNIQKVNQLAQDFMKHGIVANSQEAYAKAEAALQQSESGQVSIEDSETIMSMKRDITLMQKAIADLEKQVMFLTTKFSSMSAEILALKTRPVEQKKFGEFQTTISGEHAKQQPQPQQQQATPIRARATQTVKGQTFSEDDISIDKIFYFGKK
ncbi:MAG: hypothetical protein V1702_05625 [Candidatus Woesearchaeota archaeon]